MSVVGTIKSFYLLNMDYIPRQGASRGSWCSFLLPSSLLPFCVRYSGICRLFGAMSFFMTIPLFFNETVFGFKNASNATQFLFYNLLAVPISIMTSWLCPYGFISIYIISYTTIILFDWLTSTLLKCCPGSFSVGEAQILSQGVTVFVLSCSLSILNQYRYLLLFEDTEIPNSIKFLQILILGCLVLMYVLYKLPFLTVGLIVYVPFLLFVAVLLLVWNAYLGQNPVMWLILFCFYDIKRICLLLSWVVSVFASVTFVMWQNKDIVTEQAISVTRKYFHLVVIVVFLPGIIFDPEFLNLASGVALAVFMALETCRILKVPPIGPIIDNAFQVFLDEKDSGILILTHIYLLIGCSSPLWMYSFQLRNKVHHICLLSGIISVGFGDTAAALGGSLIGKHRWKGSMKTLEGTACAIVAQLICSAPFLYMYHELSAINICITVTAILFTSVLEAKTTQVDNVVLPLFMFSFLSWIE